MPRRNLLILFLALCLALLCYWRVERNPYLRVLAGAMEVVESRALEPVGRQRMYEGAMRGMLQSLDEHSDFIPDDEMGVFQEELDQQFGGLGMEVGFDPDARQFLVRAPMPGSPAYKAGILAGDRIQRIDGQDTEGMTMEDVLARLRGKPGTSVTLAVVHPGTTEPADITIVREVIHLPTVLGDTRGKDGKWNFSLAGHPGIGYVRISSFTDATFDELQAALKQLAVEGMRGLVLDLRNDPGGYLDAAIDVSNLFLRSGMIVSTRRRGGREVRSVHADGKAPFVDFPMAVIVNQETASAAEILAACLQDNRRAAVVGQRSYGKGTVQEMIELPPGCGMMKLTTAGYWRPSGRNIHRSPNAKDTDVWGVMPDPGLEVVLPEDEYAQWQRWRAARDLLAPPPPDDKDAAKPFVDRQLQRAVEYVEKFISD
jgi:carboxyl-terminal processing protease